MHFTVDGEGMCNLIRQVYFWESEERATKLMKSFKTIKKQQWQEILMGNASIKGISKCEDPQCWQCKDNNNPLHIDENPDKEWQKEILKEFKNKIKFVIPDPKNRYKPTIFWVNRKYLNNYVAVWTKCENGIKQVTMMMNHGRLTQEVAVKRVQRIDMDKADAHARLASHMGLPHEGWHRDNEIQGWVNHAVIHYSMNLEDNELVSRVVVKKTRGNKYSKFDAKNTSDIVGLVEKPEHFARRHRK